VYEVPAFLQQPIFVLPSLAYYDYQGVERSTEGEQQQAEEVSMAPAFDRWRDKIDIGRYLCSAASKVVDD